MAFGISPHLFVPETRIAIVKPTNYSNKVLVGSWQEDRFSRIEIPIKDEVRTTTYTEDFCVKPFTVSTEEAWDARVKSEESDAIAPEGSNAKFPSYFENYSSTYDLAFNHIPKCIRDYDPTNLTYRLGLPRPKTDFTETFGNLTRYGLLEYKKQLWDCQKQPVRSVTTKYSDDYAPPDDNYYKFKRFGTPLYIFENMLGVSDLIQQTLLCLLVKILTCDKS